MFKPSYGIIGYIKSKGLIMNKLIENTLKTRGFVKEDYLHQARAKTREAREKAKEANVRNDHAQCELKSLRKLYQNVVDENVQMKRPKEPIIQDPKRINHKTWADKVKKRDKCCDICDSTEKLEAHHLWSRTAHPTLAIELDNGVTLCETCHGGYHKSMNQTHCSPSSYYNYKAKREKHIKIHEKPTLIGNLKIKLENIFASFKQGLSEVTV